MAKTLTVHLNDTPCYDILIRDSFSDFVDSIVNLSKNTDRRIMIVTDSNVAKLYLAALRNLFSAAFTEVSSFSFPAGEASKTLSVVEELYEVLIRKHFDRKDLLIALGGGVVGDLTGFTAATYLRGIDFIQIPTTLLSQVDSSIGGKTGVDFSQYKNMVGAFYMPKLVYINTGVLSTLPKEQFSSGMAEVIKHGLIRNPFYYRWIRDHIARINALEPEMLEILIYESCKVKKAVVEADPTEQGERAVLNFGHTIGHAIEKLSNFSLFHGQCVSLGAVAASQISFKRGQIDLEDYVQIIDTFDSFGLPTQLTGEYSPKDILATTKSDKKMVGDKIKFITLHGVGFAYIDMDVTDDEILGAVQAIMDGEAWDAPAK